MSKYLRKFYDIYKNSLYPDWKIDTELLSWISLSNWINSFLQNKRWSRNFLSLAHWLMIASFSLTQKLNSDKNICYPCVICYVKLTNCFKPDERMHNRYYRWHLIRRCGIWTPSLTFSEVSWSLLYRVISSGTQS